MILKFAKQVVFILAISGVIILGYEALERWECTFMPAWESNILTLIFVSFIVAVALKVYKITTRKWLANESKLRSATEKLLESEEKYRRMFEEDLAGNFITNAEGIITDCNRSMLRIFGYSDKKELVGNHIRILYSDPDEYSRLRKELEEKKIISNYETKRKRQNGEPIEIIKNIAANTDADGKITEIKGYVYDISDRKRAEQLFSIIAHDLKAPLAGILNVSELLRTNLQSYSAEKTDRFLESICCSSENMLVMLENLLIWAKTRNGNTDYSPVKVRLNPLVDEVTDVLKASAANKNIAVRNIVAYDAFCYADVNMLKTIIRNLIQNALKYTNPGGEIKIGSLMKDHTTVISVADNGIGISASLVNEIFEGYRSNSLSGTANEKGSGLGLVLCRDFAQRNSGSIRVESEPGNGSTFFVTLPSSP